MTLSIYENIRPYLTISSRIYLIGHIWQYQSISVNIWQYISISCMIKSEGTLNSWFAKYNIVPTNALCLDQKEQLVQDECQLCRLHQYNFRQIDCLQNDSLICASSCHSCLLQASSHFKIFRRKYWQQKHIAVSCNSRRDQCSHDTITITSSGNPSIVWRCPN